MPEFLCMALGSYEIRVQIELEARSTSGVNNINGDEVRALHILLPPVNEQEAIVNRAGQLLALADQIEVRYQKAKTQIDKLTPSILAKAFRGELVPQDPNDEPAEKLLERIRAARASQPATATGKKRARSMKREAVRKQQKAKRK